MDDKARKAASVRSHLRRRAREAGRTYMSIQQYYAMEKFLLRLSKSKYAETFILKGALLLRVFGIGEMRTTKDIDLAGSIAEIVSDAESVIRSCLLETEIEEDGLSFDLESIRGEEIREHQSYGGIRVKFEAFLGSAEINMQIDIGFGDAITPRPVLIEVPQLFDEEHISIKGYTLESAIAEKFEAMVTLDMANSRMKDFYDIWFLCTTQPFKMENLSEAIHATFKRRKTDIPTDIPTALTPDFADAKQQNWQGFLKKNDILGTDLAMHDVIKLLNDFLLPVIRQLRLEESTTMKWSPAEGWA